MIIVLTQCFPPRIGGIENLISNLVLQLSEKEKIIVFADQQHVFNDTIYVVFEAPLYRLQLGDFFSRKEAEEKKKNLVKNGYKNIWIVKSRIRNRTLF